MTKGLMEHLSAKDEVLTLAGVSPGFGVLHQEFDGPSASLIQQGNIS